MEAKELDSLFFDSLEAIATDSGIEPQLLVLKRIEGAIEDDQASTIL